MHIQGTCIVSVQARLHGMPLSAYSLMYTLGSWLFCYFNPSGSLPALTHWDSISLVILTLHLLSHVSLVPDDLTPEEQQELENIRRRKQELLEDIQVILEEDM